MPASQSDDYYSSSGDGTTGFEATVPASTDSADSAATLSNTNDSVGRTNTTDESSLLLRRHPDSRGRDPLSSGSSVKRSSSAPSSYTRNSDVSFDTDTHTPARHARSRLAEPSSRSTRRTADDAARSPREHRPKGRADLDVTTAIKNNLLVRGGTFVGQQAVRSAWSACAPAAAAWWSSAGGGTASGALSSVGSTLSGWASGATSRAGEYASTARDYASSAWTGAQPRLAEAASTAQSYAQSGLETAGEWTGTAKDSAVSALEHGSEYLGTTPETLGWGIAGGAAALTSAAGLYYWHKRRRQRGVEERTDSAGESETDVAAETTGSEEQEDETTRSTRITRKPVPWGNKRTQTMITSRFGSSAVQMAGGRQQRHPLSGRILLR